MLIKEKYLSWLPKKSPKVGSILAVDDDFAIRVILHNVLKNSFNVSVFGNGIEVLLWLKEGNIPDVIVSDISMPELNGFDLLESLSQSGLYNSIPIIILSGHEESEVKSQMLKYQNPVTFIRKPFDPINVQQHLLDILQAKRLAVR
ncbi:MAG: response regulator [Cyclobacteriaceae bacterium]